MLHFGSSSKVCGSPQVALSMDSNIRALLIQNNPLNVVLDFIRALKFMFTFEFYSWFVIFWGKFTLTLSIPKIWLLILPSSWYRFPCKLVTGICCQIKISSLLSILWVFWSLVSWILYEYYREKVHVNHLWVVRNR